MQQQQKAAALAHSVVRAALVVLYDRHMTPSVRYGAQTPAEARGCARKARPRSASLIGRDANGEKEEAGGGTCYLSIRKERVEVGGVSLRGTTCGLGGARCTQKRQDAPESFPP